MSTPSIALEGTVLEVFEEQKISENFKKRLLKIKIDEDTIEGDKDFSQNVVVEFTNDKCNLLNKYSAGDYVIVDVNIRGKDFEKEGKVMNFTKLNGWRIKGNASGGNEPATQAQDASDMPGGNSQTPPASEATGQGDGGPDDLPF
jgi:hypothetical protein